MSIKIEHKEETGSRIINYLCMSKYIFTHNEFLLMSYFICLDYTEESKEKQRIKSSHKGERRGMYFLKN